SAAARLPAAAASALSSRRRVGLALAETTTTGPAARRARRMPATRSMPAAPSTELPPNLQTITAGVYVSGSVRGKGTNACRVCRMTPHRGGADAPPHGERQDLLHRDSPPRHRALGRVLPAGLRLERQAARRRQH